MLKMMPCIAFSMVFTEKFLGVYHKIIVEDGAQENILLMPEAEKVFEYLPSMLSQKSNIMNV